MKKIWSKIKFIHFGLLPYVWNPPEPDPANWGKEDVLFLVYGATAFFVSIAGVTALIIMLVGGYQYMTSFGNEEALTKAKSTLTWAVVGFILTIGAYALIRFLAQVVLNEEYFTRLFG